MYSEYIEYFIVPDQIQSDCKAREPTALNPLVLYTWMASGFHLFYPKAWVYSLLFPESLQHLRPSWVPFLPLFLACFWSPKESGKVPKGEFWRAGVLWRNGREFLTAAFALSIQGRSARKTHRKREGVQGLFYAFLAVGAVSDQCVGCLSITSSSSFSSGVPLVPLLLYFSIHLHEL